MDLWSSRAHLMFLDPHQATQLRAIKDWSLSPLKDLVEPSGAIKSRGSPVLCPHFLSADCLSKHAAQQSISISQRGSSHSLATEITRGRIPHFWFCILIYSQSAKLTWLQHAAAWGKRLAFFFSWHIGSKSKQQIKLHDKNEMSHFCGGGGGGAVGFVSAVCKSSRTYHQCLCRKEGEGLRESVLTFFCPWKLQLHVIHAPFSYSHGDTAFTWDSVINSN